MPLRLCMKYNSTVVMNKFPDGNPFYKFDETKKRFTGKLADYVWEFIYLKRKRENENDMIKYCQFIFTNIDGLKQPNGSYTGAIGHLQKNEADFYTRPHDLAMFDEKIDVSNVFGTESSTVSHYIYKKPKQIESNFNLNEIKGIFIPSIDFFLFYTFSFLISILIGIIFYYLTNRSKKVIELKNYLTFLLRFKNNLNSHLPNYLKFIILFNLLFLFWIKLFLSSNIKTNNVIVDKSQLLYNIDAIKTTNLQPCAFEVIKEGDDFLNNARKGSNAYFVLRKVYTKNYCVFFKGGGINQELGKKKFFLLSARFQSYFLKVMPFGAGLDLFINPERFISINAVLYMSKKADQKIKDEVNKWATMKIEFGFILVSPYFITAIFDKEFPSNSRIYESVNSFIDDNTIKNSNYEFAKFKSLFYFYILIILTLTLIQFAFILSKKIRLIFYFNLKLI